MRTRTQLRYLPWMARDYFLWGGVATAVIMAFVGTVFVEGIIALGAMKNPANPILAIPPRQLYRVEAQLLVALATIGPVIATRGIISSDRSSGYYRLLFARPLNGPRYYATTFVANGLGFLVVCGALLAAFSIFVVPMTSIRFFPMMALSYLFLGGIAFLLSALWRYDMLSLIAAYVAASASWDVLTSPGPKGWLVKAKWLVELLPPVHVHTSLLFAVPAGDALKWNSVAWLFGYGLVCFALGLWVLSRRQFAKGA